MADAKIRLSVEGATMAKSDLESVKASLSGLGAEAALLKTTLMSLAGSLSVGAFLSWARGTIDAADAMNDMAQRTGILVKNLAVFELASKQSGTTMESISRGVKGLSGVMSSHSEALKAAGITATDTNGAMIQLAEMFSKMPDGMEKTNLAVKIFGKSGMDLIPMLNMGKVGLQEAADKTAKYAAQMAIMAPLADTFNDNMAEIAINSKVAGMVMMNTALPALNEITRAMADASRTGGTFAGIMAGLGAGIENYKKGVNDFYGANFFNIKQPSTGGATGSWSDDGRKGLSDPRIVKPDQTKEIDASTAALIQALKTKEGGADKAEKVSEYQRLQQEITKVIAVQDVELLQGSKLAASSKYQTEELQKITFAFSTQKISQQERIKLIEMTTTATAKMLAVEKQAALIKNNQEEYAQSLEFAKELAEAEVSLSKAREQGRAVLAEYSQSIDAENAFTALEISLVGETEAAKKKAIALYRIEIDLKKQLAAIDANAGFDSAQRAEAAAMAQAAAASARAGVSSRIQLEVAEKAKQEQIDLWKQIDSTAESVFMDIAKNGKSAFQGLEDELKNGLLKLLYEMTVKKWIISIGTEMGVPGLEGLLGGGSGGLGNSLLSKGGDFLSTMIGGGGSYTSSIAVPAAGSMGTTTSLAGIEALSAGIEGLGASSTLAAPAVTTATGGLSGLASGALAALGPVGLFAAGVGALFAIFGGGKDKIPTVLNDLSLFNNSLIGLPFLELAVGSDDAAQGLRDVLYGLENATPTMRKLAGETVSLSIELMRASGDIAGARNLARNIGTRGMNEEEIAVFDYNEKLRDQIDAQRAAASAAQAGAAAAQAAAQAENQLAQTRYNIAGKLNVLLGRQTQLEFDRATALAGTTDAASISMLTLTYQLEDLYTAVDASYAKLERSIAAEKKIADLRLKSATDLLNALKTAKDAISPSLSRAFAQSQVAMYAALAKAGGALPSAASLKPALDSIAKPSEELFKTFSEYVIDQARTANDISDLADHANNQVNTEQQTIDRLDLQLENAKQALDVLKGVDTSITTAAEADAVFYASMLALTAAKSSAASYSYAAPAAASGYSGGGGGGYSGGGGSTAASDIAGMDADIVAAYNAYYGRNPDRGGYDSFVKSGLTGDAMMQAILRASIADKAGADYNYALAHGFDPDNPLNNFFHGTGTYKATTATAGGVVDGAFANGGDFGGGLRLVGERGPELEVTGPSRITNTESLLSMLKSGGNSDALVAEIRALRAEVAGLRSAADKTAANTGNTDKSLRNMTNDGVSLNVTALA